MDRFSTCSDINWFLKWTPNLKEGKSYQFLPKAKLMVDPRLFESCHKL